MTSNIRFRTGVVVLTASCALLAAACTSCGGGGSSGSATTTITLEGPNQWTSSGSTFGPAWNALVASFEKDNPKIKVKTVVLPVSQFNQTISTQLAAGTAPELVFSQASYKPYMVTHLESYLKKPNPYVPGNKAWIDLFKPTMYGLKLPSSLDTEGHVDFVPYNVFIEGIFYNKAAFAKAGIKAPITTFSDLLRTCSKLKAVGYAPFAMDDSDLGVGWTWATITNMLLTKYYQRLNYFDAAGKPGSNPRLTGKDWVKAVVDGQITSKTPEVAESLKLLKKFFDTCATKNWSGVAGTSGAMADIKDFASGTAAMAWGTDYAPAALTDLTFHYASMPFPTITKDSSPLSVNAPAQSGFGSNAGYMIPAKISGDQLKAAIKFLQWMSVGKNIQPFLNENGALPVVSAARPPTDTKGLTQGRAWGQSPKVGRPPVGPPGTTVVSLFDGYLLGAKSLSQEESYLQEMWNKSDVQAIKDNGWASEAWAKHAK